MKVLEKALFIACAGNTKEVLEEQGRLHSMERVMLSDRIHDSARHKELVLLGGTERSNPAHREAMRIQHVETARRLGEDF
jgi:NAD(P)H dehydrogenase (quinone)